MKEGLEQKGWEGRRFTFPCDLTDARQACLRAKAFLQEHDLDEVELNDWELVIAESVTNAVSYVLDEHRSKPLDLDVSVSESEVMVTIHDHTAGVRWPVAATLPEADAEGGRGMYLIQTLTDESDYRTGCSGNSLMLRKRRSVTPDSGSGPVANGSVGEGHLKETVGSLEATLDAMTAELSSCYESLSAIFHFSSQLGQSQQTEDFAKRLLDHVLAIAEADWFVFRQYLRDQNTLEQLSVSDGLGQLKAIEVLDGGTNQSVEIRTARSRQDEWLAPDDALDEHDPLALISKECHAFIHPIFLNDELLGVLSVGRSAGAGAFNAAQISFINTFAEFLAIQIVNVGYEQERISKGIFTRELEIATSIQRSLLPASLPALNGFQLTASCESAREVGGDFYDVITLDDGSFLMVIADVMGKGIPAALFAAILRSLFRALPQHAREPARLMDKVNRILYEDLSGVDMFITAQLVFVDAANRIAKVANAGHCPALFTGRDENVVREVCPDGMPLGILPDTEYCEGAITLGTSSTILIYTDGVTEATNRQGEQFGDEELRRWLSRWTAEVAEVDTLKRELLATLKHFMGGSAARDDLTFIAASQQWKQW